MVPGWTRGFDGGEVGVVVALDGVLAVGLLVICGWEFGRHFRPCFSGFVRGRVVDEKCLELDRGETEL